MQTLALDKKDVGDLEAELERQWLTATFYGVHRVAITSQKATLKPIESRFVNRIVAD